MQRCDSDSWFQNETLRDALVGKIINDFIDRKKRGENLTEEDLFRQHPELADSLRGSLRILSAVGRVTSTTDQLNTIESLVSSGALHPTDYDGYAACGFSEFFQDCGAQQEACALNGKNQYPPRRRSVGVDMATEPNPCNKDK